MSEIQYKNIEVVGCSFSLFKQTNGVRIWPELLADRLPQEITVLNRSMYCNSVSSQCLQVLQLIKNKPNLIIVQWTTNSRATFINDRNEYQTLLSGKKYLQGIGNYLQYKEEYCVPKNDKKDLKSFEKYIHLNPADLDVYDNKFIDIYKNMLLHLVGPVGPYDWYFTTMMKKFVREECKLNNIDCIMFNYLDRPEFEDRIDHLDFVVENSLIDFNSKVIDKGLHLGSLGHRDLASIIYPIVTRYIL